MDPTFGGAPIFGGACHVEHRPRPAAVQRDNFFGLSGTLATFGGTRGRTFAVRGVLVGADLPSVLAAEASLLSYADAIPRVLVDTQGRAWPNVIFGGDYRPDGRGPVATDFGYCLPYECHLVGKS